MLVFTGGIGENDAQVRAEICAGLAWIGVNLDDARNRAASNPSSFSRNKINKRILHNQK